MKISALILALVLSACGVKGPPLPPMAATPQQADQLENPRPTPSPSSAAR